MANEQNRITDTYEAKIQGHSQVMQALDALIKKYREYKQLAASAIAPSKAAPAPVIAAAPPRTAPAPAPVIAAAPPRTAPAPAPTIAAASPKAAPPRFAPA